MQPDLPWNIAGIPPEAREAARAAARREGLSVGEWLTRRILRSMAEGNSNVETARDSWRYSGIAAHNAAIDSPPASTSRDSEDMLARVSRTEADSQDATRRIEEQLRGVARRLDQSERSQSENNRAMNKAATEINIAAREQAQAFDQLGAHVMGLNDRLSRIERDAATDGLKDAVKALHQGLSRLADQMSQTANQSASQIAALAGSVEQIAGKLADTRGEIDHVAQALQDRMTGIEGRIRNAELDAHTQASAIDRALAAADKARDERQGIESELQRQASGLSQLNETLDRLTARFAAGEAQQAGVLARLEDGFAKLESRGNDAGSERRLEGIEQALEDIALRLEKTESSNLGAAGTVEEGLRSLAVRVDAADKRHREAVAELRAAVKEATGRLETIDPPTPPVPVPPPPPVQPEPAPVPPAAVPNFEIPPFPEQSAQVSPTPPPFASLPPMPDSPPPFVAEPVFAGHPFGAEAFAANAAQQASSAGAESFLAAARRSARAAAEGDAQHQNSPFGFTWGAPRESETTPKSNLTRYALIGTLAILIVAAVAAGVLFSKNLATPTPLPAPARIATPAPATHAALASPRTDAPDSAQATPDTAIAQGEPVPATSHFAVPGSPVVPGTRRLKLPALSPSRAIQSTPVAPVRVATSKIVPPQQAAATSPLDRLTALANTGNAKAELLLGLKLLDGDGVAINEAEGAKWLERSAKQNEPVAAYRLGTLYERGHGVAADAAKAAQWYEVAAKGGNRKAMHNLAVAYADGTGVQKDLVVAAQWFTRAANLGLADSQFNLAVLYERGMGVPQSLIDAYKWYAVAAQQGDAESKARIDALGSQLSPEDKTAAQKAAESFRPDATDRNANIPPDQAMVVGG